MTQPTPRLVFVDLLRVDAVSTVGLGHRPGPHGQLGAWTNDEKGEEGVVLTFFRSTRAARAALKNLEWLNGYGRQIRNVDATWDLGKSRALRDFVLGCLSTPPPPNHIAHPAPRATLATFSGHWGGHTRGLDITKAGVAHESANAGCCYLDYAMTYRIVSTHGTITHGSAEFKVLSFHPGRPGDVTGIHVGDVGELKLDNGILRNELTRDYFCSNPAWGVGGACGA